MSIPKNIAYTPLELLTGIIRMAHVGALLIILLLSVFGGIMFFLSGPGWISVACLLLAGILLMIQIVSRARYLAAVRSLRLSNGALEVRHPTSGRWVPASGATAFSSGFFLFADPWRPFTEGFPGIQITLADSDDPAYDLFGYGMAKKRDSVIGYLKEIKPEKVRRSSA